MLFIEQLDCQRFGKTTPDHVVSIEGRCRVEGAQNEAPCASSENAAPRSEVLTV